MWILTNPHHLLTMYTWDALSVNATRNETIIEQYDEMFESRISVGAAEKYRDGRNLTHKRQRGPATWKDMLRHALNDTASWQTRKWSNCTKFQSFAWMIITSSRKHSNQLENCQKYAPQSVLKCLCLARIGRLYILWSVNKLAICP